MSVLRFAHVSKRFTLHRERSRSFQELFVRSVRRPRLAAKEEFWALRDVSFAVERGEMVGLIGANGAGKSTALKLIARILEPTSGHITVTGRIGALLELGAGFHPELTGRENVFLSGTFVGLDRRTLKRRLDDIIAFSETERFIDVPVKHYSSGMYVRLAFAAAINLEPEILLVDEVLAVGDQAFQVRCLDRVRELKSHGVSVVLVTHSLEQVQDMCDRVLWLDQGDVKAEGPARQVLDMYMAHVSQHDEQLLLAADAERAQEPEQDPSEGQQRTSVDSAGAPQVRWGTREGEIVSVHFLDAQGQERRVFRTGERFIVRIHFVAKRRIEKPQFGLAIYHSSGFHINGPNTVFAGLPIDAIEGAGFIDYTVESLPLLEGTYLLSVALYDYEGAHAYDHQQQAYTFRVWTDSTVGEKYGSILIPAVWTFTATSGTHASAARRSRQGDGHSLHDPQLGEEP